MDTNIWFHIDVNSAFLSWTAIELLKAGAAQDIREIPSIIGGDMTASPCCAGKVHTCQGLWHKNR